MVVHCSKCINGTTNRRKIISSLTKKPGCMDFIGGYKYFSIQKLKKTKNDANKNPDVWILSGVINILVFKN
jgi:hypothetical protein